MSKLPKIENFAQTLKKGIWILGTSSWLFGISDRSLATLADGYLFSLLVGCF